MKTSTKAKVQKFFRVTHGWLGLFVFPWILVIGLTGLYLNHSKLVLGWIGSSSYDESQFAEWPEQALSQSEARIIAASVWPNETITKAKGEPEPYHGFASFAFTKPSGLIIVTRDTGHYFVKTNITRRTFAPDGTQLHRKIYWSSVFKWLHVKGWLDNTFSTWLADITAGAMVIFAISGLWLFFAPRTRRIGRRMRALTGR